MIIKREKIDIVHTNGILNIVPVFAATLSRVKVVWHLNDTLTPWILRKLFLPLVKLLSEKVALASKKVGEHYFGKHNKLWNKSIVFYAPVDTKKFDSDSIDTKKIIDIKAEINISADDLVIGTIGNINMAKGYEYFIEAASYLKREENRAKFVVVGAKLDSRVDYYRKICNLIHYFHLEKDVILTGFRSDIVEILSIFDVFVLSSVSEACPLVVLEALAMKVPVVATNVGGVSEQIIHNENGILVEPFRSDLLAEGILRIINLSKKDLQKMVNTGRERVEKIFSPDKITKKYKDVYAKVLG